TIAARKAIEETGAPNCQPASLLYERPTFSQDARVFGDLVWYAPGLNTSLADIYAALEAEAKADPDQQLGQVDDQARKLIDKGRAGGWMNATVPASGRTPSYTVYFNGAGQFAWDCVLPCGLRE